MAARLVSQSLGSVVSFKTNGDPSSRKIGAVVRAKAFCFKKRLTCCQDSLSNEASRDVTMRSEKEIANGAGLRLLQCQFSSVEREGDRRGSISATLLLHMAASYALCDVLIPQNAGANAIAAYPDIAAAPLEVSVLFLYFGGLLVLLGFGSFLVVRQVLVKRELENAAKELQDRVRSGQGSSDEYFELGAIMLRKKYYVLANKYLEQAISKWEGEEQELAQVYNALGFSCFSEEKFDKAIINYKKAVALQPAYVTAWNNLGDLYERQKEYSKALQSYESALVYDPSNKVAESRAKDLRGKVERLSL